MVNEKKDPGGVGLQIEAPSPCPSPVPTKSVVSLHLPNLPKPLTLDEKKYLLSVERGDLPNVRRMLQRAHRRHNIDINCVDSLGRGALTIAIDGENLEMVELLVIMAVETKDALLQAINAEFVEAVELLLEHEELIHKPGEPYSWQKVETNTSMFTSDITPLILAAHRNNYEILKILLDRGATIPIPHDIKCGCDDCIHQSTEDSLRFSLSRVNEYRALSSPSLIALSSNDPLLTAFQLSWELRGLAFAEQESKSQYLDLRRQCQNFAVNLLDQSRSSQELAIILNYDPDAPPYEDGDQMKLARLELAINYKQKKFVAHPNIQQLLASLWYEGVPGFRRKSSLEKLITIIKVALLFPIYCLIYMIAPNCSMGVVIKKPFMKFLIHASSYLFFLGILILVSQRAEVHFMLLFGTENMKRSMEEQMRRQRGNGPTPLELLVVLYVIGFIWEETQEIFLEGIKSYLRNMWNFIDFSRNFLYCLVGLLRVIAYIQQQSEISRDPSTAYIAREHWYDYDPQLIAEGLFAAANIFSALKLVHLFSINPHLGPLQISLGRMVIDIVKFFFIYSLVLFAFACGLNQLLWYFADLEKQKCYILPDGGADWDNTGDACMKWRRFGNLFESSQSLFWASFGMVGLESFELEGIKTYTRFWGLLMFGSYSVINVIVLLNLLIAMMSNSYAMIDEHSDTEWKFARTKLWLSYFDEGATLPPPFNILPSVKWITRWCKPKNVKQLKRGSTIRRKEDRENRYINIMRSLVWRYVATKHQKDEENVVTEDDINEVKCDISAMRYEMLEIFERNGMDISSAEKKDNKGNQGKKMKVWERRLMKDFQVSPITTEEDAIALTAAAAAAAAAASVVAENQTQITINPNQPPSSNEKGINRFRNIAKKVVDQTTSHKWSETVNGVRDTQIGRCHNRESFKNQQNLQRAINEAKRLMEKSPLPRSGSCSPVEYYDPQSHTLMELLKNISEEIEDNSPATSSKININMASKLVNQISPAASLTKDRQQQRRNSGHHEPIMMKNLMKQSNTSNSENKQRKSSIGTDAKKSTTTTAKEKPNSKFVPKEDLTKQKILSISSNTSSSSATSSASSRRGSHSSIIDDPIPLLSTTPGSCAPKVVKRKAPPNPLQNSTDSDIAISRPIAMKPLSGQGLIPPPPPVQPITTTTPIHNNTTIKTPTVTITPSTLEKPNNIKKTSNATPSRSSSPTPSTTINTMKSVEMIDTSSASGFISTSNNNPSTTMAIGVSSSTPGESIPLSESSENLITTVLNGESIPAASSVVLSPATAAAAAITSTTTPITPTARMCSPSPKCLRPQRKIDDVTTVKRQPKAGWL